MTYGKNLLVPGLVLVLVLIVGCLLCILFEFTKPPKRDRSQSEDSKQIAFDAGWQAFHSGKSKYANPFQSTPLWASWHDGWTKANDRRLIEKITTPKDNA